MQEPVHSCLLYLSQQNGQNSGGMLSRRRRLLLRQRTSSILTVPFKAAAAPAASLAAGPVSAEGRAGAGASTGGSTRSTLSGTSGRGSLRAGCVGAGMLVPTGGRCPCSSGESLVLRPSGSPFPAVCPPVRRAMKRDLSGLGVLDFRFDE
jgi:hypothetical protein